MRIRFFCLALLLALPLMGCKGLADVTENVKDTVKSAVTNTLSPKSDLVVFQILMGSELNENNEIVDRTATFDPTERNFHVHAFFSDLTEPVTVVGSWWILPEPPEGQALFVETGSGVDLELGNKERGQMIYEIPVTVEPDAPVAKFHLQNTEDWPGGQYRFEISEDGKLVTEVQFFVVDGAAKMREFGL